MPAISEYKVDADSDYDIRLAKLACESGTKKGPREGNLSSLVG